MTKTNLSTPTIEITKTEARRFMLAHHGLYPPRTGQGKNDILDFIRHVGSIQFDPINIVGRNPDLVLQSRVKDYRPSMLDDLLYKDRALSDGWDKMASVYTMEDWPYFLRRKHFIRNQSNLRHPTKEIIDRVLEEIRVRGPLSSLDIKGTEKVDWSWGPTKAARAALEHLYSEGYLGIDHRINNRRSFDLTHRLVPAQLLEQPDPFKDKREYQEWHILRRVGSMGLVSPRAGEYWYGILGIKSPERNQIIQHLLDMGSLILVNVLDLPNQAFYVRKDDIGTLDLIRKQQPVQTAAFIAALDNLIWNRGLIQHIFDFEYVWEVYKPKTQRKYGYYVLPVLYGDHFIARIEPAFDKKQRIFTIKNWWWEKGIKPNRTMQDAMAKCVNDFMVYLGASQLKFGESMRKEDTLGWVKNLRKTI